MPKYKKGSDVVTANAKRSIRKLFTSIFNRSDKTAADKLLFKYDKYRSRKNDTNLSKGQKKYANAVVSEFNRLNKKYDFFVIND